MSFEPIVITHHEHYSLLLTPMGAPRMTKRDQWTDVAKGKGRPAVLRYFAYRGEIRRQLPGFRLPVELRLTFFIPMPASWSLKKRQQMVGAPHDQKPDIDNLVKGFMDAFGPEDKHVAIIHAEKYWGAAGLIEVTV